MIPLVIDTNIMYSAIYNKNGIISHETKKNEKKTKTWIFSGTTYWF